MAASEDSGAPARAGEAARVAEHLFRHEAGKLVATLTRMFGIDRLQLAEDVVQEALIRAMQSWPYYGAPAEPEVRFDTELPDDRLRMMFACCHPVLPPEARVALALKTLCGLGTGEIAAFLAKEAAIAKRLTRARAAIRDAGVAYEIPHGDALAERLESVEQTLYLLFNEGYKASRGDRLLREDLCREAIRLVELLTAHPAGDNPRTHALAALMLLNAARFPERLDGDGQLLRLQEQNRANWDRSLIARGMHHIGLAASGKELSAYHIQAGIAACHCAAPDYAATNWRQILALYDQWVARDNSPVVALNRAVALANVEGPGAGKAAVEAIGNRKALDGYYLYYAVLGDFEARLGNHGAATAHFQEAINRTAIASERAFLE